MKYLYLILDGKRRGRLLSNDHRFYHIRIFLLSNHNFFLEMKNLNISNEFFHDFCHSS